MFVVHWSGCKETFNVIDAFKLCSVYQEPQPNTTHFWSHFMVCDNIAIHKAFFSDHMPFVFQFSFLCSSCSYLLHVKTFIYCSFCILKLLWLTEVVLTLSVPIQSSCVTPTVYSICQNILATVAALKYIHLKFGPWLAQESLCKMVKDQKSIPFLILFWKTVTCPTNISSINVHQSCHLEARP